MAQFVKKLPAVFQTVTEKKFFDATFDQLLSKKDSDYLSAYIGRRTPGYHHPITDFYLPQPTKNRTWWQLEPVAYARNPDTTKTNLYFYEDLLENIEYYGGNISNQDRLFSSEYYSYAPPIDYDMFVNFHDYYWVDQRLPTITITGVMGSDIIGQHTYTTGPSASPANFTISSGMSVILSDDPAYQEPHTVQNKGRCVGLSLVPHFSDITAGATFEFIPWDGSMTLSTGRTIDNQDWDGMTWDTQYRPSLGDYITIERGCVDRNAWSRTNKWYHIDVIKSIINETGEPFPAAATRALRPILQFSSDIQLYKSGSTFLSEIRYGFLQDSSNSIIRFSDIDGQDVNTVNGLYGTGLEDGNLICFFGDDTSYLTSEVRRHVFRVTVELDSSITLIHESAIPVASDGDIFLTRDNAPNDGGKTGETWYLESGEWNRAYNNKVSLNQAPLFQLFDHNSVPLDNSSTYPDSSFRGNKIFSYKENQTPGAAVDPVLRFPILYTDLGQSSDIVFQNNLIVDRYTYGESKNSIVGYYYFKNVSDNTFNNAWELYNPCPCDDIVPPPPCNCIPESKQRVIDRFVVGYGSDNKFKLSSIPHGYPVTPDLVVSVNGTEVKAISEQVDGYTFTVINNSLYVDLGLYLDTLGDATDKPHVVEIASYTHDSLDADASGYFEIPQQLEANPSQEEISEISGSSLIEHFTSIIKNQIGFSGIPYGGPTNYRDTRKNASAGKFILQNKTPLLKAMLVSQRGDTSFIDGVRLSSDEYTKFKNKFIKVAQQLINQEFSPVEYSLGTVKLNYWVDEILKIANVSKEFSSAFEFSYMVGNGTPYFTEELTGVTSGPVLLNQYVDLADHKNSLYVYEVTSDGIENLLIIGQDYEITSTNFSIELNILNAIPSSSKLVFIGYKNPLPAFIPATPSKLGTYPTFVPKMEIDYTYAEPTWVIYGHDGSKSIAYGTLNDIDYRDSLLLELEKRIYNLIEQRFRKEYDIPLRIESVRPGYFRSSRYLIDEYLTIAEPYLNKWSAKVKANYRINDWEVMSSTTSSQNLWKLYNYRNSIDTNGDRLDIPGNWRGIFLYLYDTIRPDTCPWEMFGFSSEPTWWRYEYGQPVTNSNGQSVWTSSAAGNSILYQDIEDGIIRQGPTATYGIVGNVNTPVPNALWKRSGILGKMPVDTSGELRSPIEIFDLVYSGNPLSPFDGFDNDWIFGDISPVEHAWMSTSSYPFTLQEILFLTRPAAYGELFWDTLGVEYSYGTASIPESTDPVKTSTIGQYVQNERYLTSDSEFSEWSRPKNQSQVLHGENINGSIEVRHGYQRWISDRILFLGKDVSTEFGQKVRTLGVNLANKLAGFTNKDTTSLYIESISPASNTSTLSIPSNNFDVILHKGSIIDTITYSGIVVRAIENGLFVIYGYDLLSSAFKVFERSNSTLIDITVGGQPAEFKHYNSGETYLQGDIVRHNGVYYISNSTQNVTQFSSGSWSKLKSLPSVGGVSVSYKPVSTGKIKTLPYGSVLNGVQEVFDTIIGWGEYLESRGWKFDEVNSETNQVLNWELSAKEFLFWINNNWAPDSSIQLSPASNKATLEISRGYAENIETISNGAYSILDKYGSAIAPADVIVEREGSIISISPTDVTAGGIYFCQVNTAETEHVIIVDNTTDFNDIVYSPLLRARQQRLKFNGFRTNSWSGKMQAPGYLVVGNSLVPNYDTIVDAMRYYYDSNILIDNSSIEDLGKHLIGHESKSYLNNLQISNDVQYLFYKGAIRQKGTTQSLDKLSRSTVIQNDDSLEIYEEWALKLGSFGNSVEQVSTEFKLVPELNNDEGVVARFNYSVSPYGVLDKILIINAEKLYDVAPTISISAPASVPNARIAKAYAVLDASGKLSRIDITDKGYGYENAPTIDIVSVQNTPTVDRAYGVWKGETVTDVARDNIIDVDVDDTDMWTLRPPMPSTTMKFPTIDYLENEIITAGYVHFNDINHSAFDIEDLAINWGTSRLNAVGGESVWVAKTFTDDWGVYKLVDYTDTSFSIIEESNDLYVKVDSSITIGSQGSTLGTRTDLGNLVVLQALSNPASVAVTVSPGSTAPAVTGAIEIPSAALATAQLNSSGLVTGITIIEAGNGYTSTPSVSIDPAYKEQAVLQSVIIGGAVSSLNIVDQGIGYVNPVIEIDPPEVENATAEVILGSSGEILAISAVNPGMGYTAVPTIVIEPPASGTQATATVTSVVGGKVVGISLTNAGSGYTTQPRVFVSAPTAAQATATPIVNGTKIVGYTITNPGAGYVLTPNVSVTYPDAVDARINSVTVSSGSVTSISLIPGTGTGYSNVPVVGIEPCPGAGSVLSVPLASGGIFYPKTSTPTVTIEGDGVGAYAVAVMQPGNTGIIDHIDIISGGSGYTYATAVIESPSASGTAAITDAEVISGGNGYLSIPVVSVADISGSGAILKAHIQGSKLDRISVINGGSGYVNPTVVVSPPETITPTANYAVGLQFDRTEAGYSYYKLQSLSGIQLTVEEIPDYEDITNILLFKNLRFLSLADVPAPGGYISNNELFWCDGYEPSTGAISWSVNRYSSTGSHIAYRRQQPLVDSRLFESASIFDSRSRDLIALLPVFDPVKGILPSTVKQNLTYISQSDPARYNITSDNKLFTQNVVFAENNVGKLWWDTSTTRFVQYEQPRYLDSAGNFSEDPSSNLEYIRQNWGKLFPGSTVDVYEWVKSDVVPSQYIGSGTPRYIDTYISQRSINRTTGIVETNYYFWVLNPTTISPRINRSMSAADVSRILLAPKSQNYSFFSPIQVTETNSSILLYNVQSLLAHKTVDVQLKYRLSNRDDQRHVQWSMFRENDTLSTVASRYWDKMVDSLCGYTEKQVASSSANSILIDGMYILPVPDPSLSLREKYGIEYRPRQSMFLNLPEARRVFVQKANLLLKRIPVRDDNPGWYDSVNTSTYWEYTDWVKTGTDDLKPSIVFSTLQEASTALSSGELPVDTIIRVIEGTTDGRYVVYRVIMTEVGVLAFDEIAIENSAIKLKDTIYSTSGVLALSFELRELLNALRTEVFIDENLIDQNSLFASMIQYVLSEQGSPDWIFKTSYIHIKENNVPLVQSNFFLPDQTGNILGYVRDSKPYHTQVRSYTTKNTLDDTALGTAFDSHKARVSMKFGPQPLTYYSPTDNNINANFGWDLNQGPYYLPWDSEYEIENDKFFVSNWDNGYYIDNTGISPVPVVVLQQFMSGNPTDSTFVPTPGNDWPDIITHSLTTPAPDKKGFSQLYPYTFLYSDLTRNDPQSFVAPETIVAIRADSVLLLYGYDYYVQYDEDNSEYTVYFFNDPSVYTTLTAMFWLDGGSLQNIRFNTYRNEIALGFPKDNLVMNVDTKLALNDLSGVTLGTAPSTFTAPYGPLIGWGDIWDGEFTDPVVSDIITDLSGTLLVPWDAPINTVIVDNTISFKSDTDAETGLFIRNNDANSGTLVSDVLAPTENTYNLEIITVSASSDIFPNINNDRAAIWIDGERIEYRRKELVSAGVWELSDIRRGTAGTAITDHYAMVPMFSSPSTLVPNVVWVERNNSLTSTAGTVVWNATIPVPNPGTEVEPGIFTDVTAVPMGGLWYSTTGQATFLKLGLGKSIN